jgi:hypothetical protein
MEQVFAGHAMHINSALGMCGTDFSISGRFGSVFFKNSDGSVRFSLGLRKLTIN